MAKVSIKSEKLTPFGGIFHARELFHVFFKPNRLAVWIICFTFAKEIQERNKLKVS